MKYISKIKLQHAKCISFDLFDTLISRFCASPDYIFYRVGLELTQLGQINDPEEFKILRKKAEFELRQGLKFKQEVTISNIYSKLIQDYPKLDPQQGIEIELGIEEYFIYPIKSNWLFLEELVNQKKRVVITSDIYLPSNFIKKIVKKYITPQAFNALGFYISSELKLLKSTGEMFYYLANNENLDPSELLHIGDNINSDFNIPKQIGISSEHYAETNLTRYENALYSRSSCDNFNELAGLMKAARLANNESDPSKEVIWNTSSNVSGILITTFCSWLGKKLIEHNAKKVFFLSRDGQIMQKVFNKLFPNFETEYLYVSRQALLFPSITSIDDEALDWILAPTSQLTLEIIFKRLNINKSDFNHPIFQELSNISWNTQLSTDQNNKLRQFLKTEMFLNYIQPKVIEAKKNLLGYLSQKGIKQENNIHIVDVGWSGTLQRSLSRLLSSYTFGYYIGVKKRSVNSNEGHMYGFLMDTELGTGISTKDYLVPFIELFCNADHAGVHSYRNDGDKYSPVLLNREAAGISWGVHTQQNAILEFSELCKKRGIDLDFNNKTLEAIAELMTLLFKNPTKTEAKVYGSFLDAEDQNESYYYPLARAYTALDSLKFAFSSYRHHHNEWQEGALAMTNPILKSLISIMGNIRSVFYSENESSKKTNWNPKEIIKIPDGFILKADKKEVTYPIPVGKFTANKSTNISISCSIKPLSTGEIKNGGLLIKSSEFELSFFVLIGAKKITIKNQYKKEILTEGLTAANNYKIEVSITDNKVSFKVNNQSLEINQTISNGHYQVLAVAGNTETEFTKFQLIK